MRKLIHLLGTYTISFKMALDILRLNSADQNGFTRFTRAYIEESLKAQRPDRPVLKYHEYLLTTGAKIKIGPPHPGDLGLRLVLAGYADDGSDLTRLKMEG